MNVKEREVGHIGRVEDLIAAECMYIKHQFLSNRVFNDYDQLLKAGTDAYRTIEPQCELLKSVWATAWLPPGKQPLLTLLAYAALCRGRVVGCMWFRADGAKLDGGTELGFVVDGWGG